MGQEDRYPLVAVAIKKDKCSQGALRWTIDHLIKKGQTLILLHINTNASGSQQHDPSIGYNYKGAVDPQMRELFIPFRVFCTRKAVKCKDVVVEDHDVTKGIVEFVSYAAIEMLVIGGPSHSSFMRFKGADLSTTISKGTPDFCTVYMISKTEKVISERKSIRPAPGVSQLRAQILNQASIKPDTSDHEHEVKIKGEMTPKAQALCLHDESIKSPFCRGNPGRKYADHYSKPEIDITYVSSGRPSIDKAYPPRLSNHSNGPFDHSFESTRTPPRSADTYSFGNDFSPNSGISSVASWQSQNLENVDAEMMRLRWEFKHNMEMYNTSPYREATMAFVHNELRQKEHEERVALAFAEKTKAAEKEKAAVALKEKEHAAMEAAKMQKKVSDQQIRRTDETQKKNAVDTFVRNVMYRRYTIEEIEKATNNFAENLKVGEGGYGPVYKCYLDHTHVAVKVLRPDAAQGRTQFLQEVEVLSCMRHPNMVILLGACPEYGCLVYEYMAKGSLEDRLYRRGNTPPIPWQHRFRIAAEIATGLLFLHQAKPEPLVHRDLKPGNILLDRNYVSKISDVGLARLIPPSIADSVIQYRMTSAAGTFCYIDPEYQQTGMLGVKSDVYSLGIMLLQIITAKPPMGLTHYVTGAIEKGAFREVLDPSIKDWPVQEAMRLAEIALKCTELQKKDRPDLAEDVLPELERLSALGEEDMDDCF